MAGIAIVSHLHDLGIEPGDIQLWAAMCQELAANETEVQVFARAALTLQELRDRTGLNAEALQEKVRSLENKVAFLEPQAQKLKGCQQELGKLEKRRRSIAVEVDQLEKRHKLLSRGVTEKEQREAELSPRIQELEQRAQAADERLAVARRELQTLAGLGLSLDDLPGFVQRIAGVAQRQGLESFSNALNELKEKVLKGTMSLPVAASSLKRHHEGLSRNP